MKILLLSQYWHPENGVPQRRWSWLSKLLVQAGHEVTVIAPPPHYARRISFSAWIKESLRPGTAENVGPSGERIIRSPYLPAGRSLTARALNQGFVGLGMLWAGTFTTRQLRGYHPDLIIGTVPAIPTAFVTPFLAWRFGAPYVIDLRDAWPDLLVERTQWNAGTGTPSIRERVLSRGPLQMVSAVVERLLYRSFRFASGIIVTSRALEEHLVSRPQFKGRSPQTTTIRNVFPPRTTYLASDKSHRPTDTLNVLYAGTLGRAQKLFNALEAARIARDMGLDITLRLVGTGAAMPELKRMVEQGDYPVEIVGRIPAEDLYTHYDWADTALVHLTDWESLDRAVPSKAYELMASDIHITGVVAGEAAELITELGAGDVVPPEDPQALAQLWADLANDRSRLGVPDTGRRWVQQQRDEAAPQALFDFLDRIDGQQ